MAFDFDAALSPPSCPQPGLRELAPGARQLTPTVAPQRGLARHLREKLAVLGCFADQALLAREGFDASPALAALAAQAAQAEREHPDVVALHDGVLHAKALGWSIDAEDRPVRGDTAWSEVGDCLAALPAPWRRAALLSLAFAEDFVVIDARDGSMPWLAVALPSMWEPERLVGRSFADVHGPIADDANPAALAGAELRWERFFWTITRHPRLHAHPRRVDPAPWPDDLHGDALAAQAWFRSERQTSIPLPGSNQAIVTIAVDVQPLAQALAEPGRAARVHDALAAMSPALLAHRGLAPVQERLLRWLAARR
ncbi:MAG: DUF3445 domain-containing protein [Burkholderiaceae bacterium]